MGVPGGMGRASTSRPALPGVWALWAALGSSFAMSLSIDEPANSRLFVVAGRSTSVSGAACGCA